MSRAPVYGLIDCNNFFASCERVFRPDLWDKPVAVLSNNDGCIIARSEEVRDLDIPMAAPYFKWEKELRDHNVQIFSANFRLYGDCSQRVTQILEHFCPRIEVYSIDESFIEISDLAVEDYAMWGRELREKVLRWTGIPVSVGLAPTKTLAKIASHHAKYGDGTYIVQNAKQIETMLKNTQVKDVWGVGWRTTPKLKDLGIATAYDLAQASDGWAESQLTIRGLMMVRELRGEPCFGLEVEHEPRHTIARTRSFGNNVRNYNQLEAAVASFSAQAAAKLRQQDEVASSIMVFLRTGKHAHVQRAISTLVRLPQASDDTGTLISYALKGLKEIYDPDFGYRKGGVVLVGLRPKAAWQLAMLDAPSADKLDKQTDLMQTVDALNKKYATRLVRHASENTNLTRWHGKHERQSPAYTTNWAELPVVHV